MPGQALRPRGIGGGVPPRPGRPRAGGRKRNTGGALARLQSITPPGLRASISLSLTDEPPLAHAIVIITAEPDGESEA